MTTTPTNDLDRLKALAGDQGVDLTAMDRHDRFSWVCANLGHGDGNLAAHLAALLGGPIRPSIHDQAIERAGMDLSAAPPRKAPPVTNSGPNNPRSRTIDEQIAYESTPEYRAAHPWKYAFQQAAGVLIMAVVLVVVVAACVTYGTDTIRVVGTVVAAVASWAWGGFLGAMPWSLTFALVFAGTFVFALVKAKRTVVEP